MASAGTVVSLDLVGRGCTVVARACSSTASDVALCRNLLPSNCCFVIAPFVRLGGSTATQRSLERITSRFNRISSATGNGAMSWNSVCQRKLQRFSFSEGEILSGIIRMDRFCLGTFPKLDKKASGSPGVDVEKYRSKLEALFYCEKEIPEEKIEKPTGVPSKSLPIGNKPMCGGCQAKGAVWCPTCTGSGLYVDSVLESQGIIVKVKCLGCGGTGSTMCPKCGGRGYSEV